MPCLYSMCFTSLPVTHQISKRKRGSKLSKDSRSGTRSNRDPRQSATFSSGNDSISSLNNDPNHSLGQKTPYLMNTSPSCLLLVLVPGVAMMSSRNQAIQREGHSRFFLAERTGDTWVAESKSDGRREVEGAEEKESEGHQAEPQGAGPDTGRCHEAEQLGQFSEQRHIEEKWALQRYYHWDKHIF